MSIAVNLARCQALLTIWIASLSLSSTLAWADDAKAPSPAASASQAVVAGIFLRKSCAPAYPDAALKAKASGVTRVRFTIDPAGAITNAEVVQTSGPLPENKSLDQAAVDALSRCPIRAGRDDNGQPVSAQIVVTYEWVLTRR
jgi:periplasmic protein TonB